MGESRGHSKPCNQAVKLEVKTMVCSFMLPVPWEMSGQSLGLSLPDMQHAESLFLALVCSALYNAVVLCFYSTSSRKAACGETWATGNGQHKIADCSGKAAPIQQGKPPHHYLPVMVLARQTLCQKLLFFKLNWYLFNLAAQGMLESQTSADGMWKNLTPYAWKS